MNDKQTLARLDAQKRTLEGQAQTYSTIARIMAWVTRAAEITLAGSLAMYLLSRTIG